jgi:ABC-type amino acid transport substrate-binding protein
MERIRAADRFTTVLRLLRVLRMWSDLRPRRLGGRPGKQGDPGGPWRPDRVWCRGSHGLGAALAAALLLLPLPPLAAASVLRVGVLDGSPPCSEQKGPSRWQGRAVTLWTTVASGQRLPYVMQGYPSVSDLLEASRLGAIDVGVGCITVTEARLGRYHFSLPFQESGLAVMVRTSRLEASKALLLALLDPQLLRVLLGYLLAIALISGLVWWDEHRVHWAGKGWREALRSYALVFQVMATGPGTNMIVSRTRGHGLVLLSWVVRIVGASLIVSTITLEVLRQPPPVASLPRSLDDLRGLRVAARPGSVSEAKLREPPLAGRLRLVPLPSVADAVPMLLNDQADAVLADEQQLVFARSLAPPNERSRLQLALRGHYTESQAFVYGKELPEPTALRIDQGISRAKQQGLLR